MPPAPVSGAPAWKSPYRALLLAEGLAIAAFATSMPIIPLYIQDLGVGSQVEITWWAGLIQSAASIALAIFAPIWGAASERYGKRLMLLRAMLAGCLIVGLMTVISSPWQLLVLRILQGCLTGTVAAATVLMVSIVPREKAGETQGMLTTAVFVGNSAGPLLGGLVADLFGHRMTFLATALLLLASAAILWRRVREPGPDGGPPPELHPDHLPPPDSEPAPLPSSLPSSLPGQRPLFDFSPLRAMPALAGLLLVGFAIQCAGSIIYPMLPLFVQSLGGASNLVGSATGLILGVSAISAALSAMLAGRLGSRYGFLPILQICMLGAFLFTLPQALVTHPWQLAVLRAAASAFLGGSMPAINALIAIRVPRGQQGGIFGLSSSLNACGNAVGPAIGSAVATSFGLPAVFLAGGLCLILTSAGSACGIRHFRRVRDDAAAD